MGENMKCTMERIQFYYPGSGGKINRRTGEVKKFTGGKI
jgi:hypothetical protein